MKFDEKLKTASAAEKIEAVDKKLIELFKKCPKKKRRELVSPILKVTNAVRWKQRSRSLVIPAIIFSIIAVYLAFDPEYFLIRVATKKAMIKFFPNFDYSSLYNSECLIDNPFLDTTPGQMEPEDCQVCAESTVDNLENVDPKVFSEELIDGRVSVIKDAMSRWKPAVPVANFKFNEFVKLHLQKEVFRKTESFCYVKMKVPSDRVYHVPGLFKYIYKNWKNNTLHFSASWTNCDKTSFNLIRNYYDKAYFLPEMTEVARYQNTVFISSRVADNKDSIWLRADIYDEAIWIGQIYGNMQIRLVPKPECQKICKTVSFALKQGEVFNYVSRFYSLYFRSNQGPAVAIGVGYIYN